MTKRTRNFVIVSLAVLGIGLGTGLVAYYVGFPAGALGRAGGPEELAFVPRDASAIAFANVHEIMTSELRQKVRRALPMQENGQRELQNRTGINIETDVDRIVACLYPDRDSATRGAGMVLARGRFDEVKIEALMRERGAQVETYNGKRLVVADHMAKDADVDPADASVATRRPGHSFAVSFMEPGLVAIGSTSLIRSAIDLHHAGNNPQKGLESVTGNEELMNLVRAMDAGNAWAVGRFDALMSHAKLPQGVASQIPAIRWFSASGHVNGGVSGQLRAEARDEQAGQNLRDVVNGFLALARLQSGNKPEMQALVSSLQLSGSGKTVALSFAIPAEVIDALGAAGNALHGHDAPAGDEHQEHGEQ
jgi:hypothetical protein